MKFMFEINTTTSKPIYLYFDEKTILSELHEFISIDIECNTMLMRSDIIDIFVQNNTDTLSVPNNDTTLDVFLKSKPQYFSELCGSLYKNIHKLYIMDKQYLNFIQQNKPAPIYENNQNQPKKPEGLLHNILTSTFSFI